MSDDTRDDTRPTCMYKCTKCGQVQKWEAWSGKAKIALKCHKCNKLTLHEVVLPDGGKK